MTWIKLNDRLPEKDKLVELYICKIGSHWGIYYGYLRLSEEKSTVYWCTADHEILQDVTHWRELESVPND